MNDTLARYFKAMQRGPEGLEELITLFTEDAVYIEPFTPGGGIHSSREAIAAWLRISQEYAPPDIHLIVDRIDARQDEIDVNWTCESPAFARPSRGRDRFTLRAGQIARLETVIIEPPEPR